MEYAEGYYDNSFAVEGSEQYGFSSKNNEQIALTVQIPALDNATFTTFLSFSEKAAPYSIERLRACGWDGDDLSDLRGIGRNKVTVQLKYDEFEGKRRLKADIVTVGRFEMEKPMDDKTKREFGAKFRNLAKTTRTPAAGAPGSGADFPFGANAPGGQQSAPPAHAASGGRRPTF